MITLDYSKMAYPIEDVPMGKSVVEKFSDLSTQADVFMREDDLPEGVDGDIVMRYLIYMFSPNSPVVAAFPDIQKRKQFVLNKLGVTANESEENGNVPDGYGEMCLMKSEWIIDRFIAFSSLHASEDYSIANMAAIQIQAMQRGLMTTPITRATDYKAYSDGLENWRKTLVEARQRIMQDENSITLQRAVTFTIRSQALGIQPEIYARIWREKREIFPEVAI